MAVDLSEALAVLEGAAICCTGPEVGPWPQLSLKAGSYVLKVIAHPDLIRWRAAKLSVQSRVRLNSRGYWRVKPMQQRFPVRPLPAGWVPE